MRIDQGKGSSAFRMSRMQLADDSAACLLDLETVAPGHVVKVVFGIFGECGLTRKRWESTNLQAESAVRHFPHLSTEPQQTPEFINHHSSSVHLSDTILFQYVLTRCRLRWNESFFM